MGKAVTEEKREKPRFATQMLASFVHGLLMLVLLFFVGLLLEAALNSLGALTVYGIPSFAIPITLGAFGFLQAIAYELSRRLEY